MRCSVCVSVCKPATAAEFVDECCVRDAVRGGEICCLSRTLRRRQIHIAGFDPDSRDQFTALHWACYWGKTEVCAIKSNPFAVEFR